MLDWEGNMQPKKDRQHRIVFDDVEDDVNMVASLSITPLEQEAIDTHLIEDNERPDEVGIPFIPTSGDCVPSTLGSRSNTLVDLEFNRHMCEKERDGQIGASIGSTNTLQSRYISDSETEADEQSHDDPTCNDVDECFDLFSDLDGDGANEGWMSSFLIQQLSQDHKVSLLNTYLRYGAYPTKMLKGQLTRQLKRLYAHKTLRCHVIIVQMTVCCVIDASRIISLWIPSLPSRRVEDPLEVIHVANSL